MTTEVPDNRSRRYFDAEVETMSTAELERLQVDGLNRFLDRAVRGNPWFENRGFKPGEVRSVSEMKNWPTMRKADVIADIASSPPFGARTTVAASEIRQFVETSGTSGAGRERYPLSEQDLRMVIAMEVPGFRWAGLEPGGVVVSSLPVTTRAGGQWYHDAVRRLGGVWLSVGTYPAEDKLRYMQDLPTAILVASASYLLRLEAIAEEMGVDVRSLDVGAIITAGETFSVAWAEERQERWGCIVYEQYGSTQRSIAWSCEEGVVPGGERGVLHVMPHLAVYEIVDPETGAEVGPGEAGELVITPFSSTASPLVRFATGDRVVKVAPKECVCGRSLPGIRSGSIDRYDSMVKLRGVNVIPSVVDTVVIDGRVTDYQARVFTHPETAREEIEITVTSDGGDLSAEELARLASRFRREIGLRATFRNHDGRGFLDEFTVDSRKRKRWVDERSTRSPIPTPTGDQTQ